MAGTPPIHRLGRRQVVDGAPPLEPQRPIWPVAVVFFALGGSIVALGYRRPLNAMLFNVLVDLLSLGVNLALSVELDRRRARSGRDSWVWSAALAGAAALLCEPICWAVARLPFLSAGQHPLLFHLERLAEQFFTFLLWTLVHTFVRSGERALLQERTIAAVREAMLRDENEALLFTLNPGFLLDALNRIGAGIQRGADAAAEATVIALAEHMRTALSEQATGATPELAAAEDAELDARRRELARYDEADARRRFRFWTFAGWAGLLVVVFILTAQWRGGVAYLVLYAPQPVLGAFWCLLMDRALGRPGVQPLKRLYVGAAVLCGLGLLLAGAAMFAATAALGLLATPYSVSKIPGIEFYYMAPAFLAWTAAWFVLDARRREAARLRSAAEIREAALKARNAMLRQQVNPHFLFNALNALYALILDGDQERALGVIGAIRRFVERAGDAGQDDLVALAGELATQDAYLDIERVRFGDRLQVERRVSADLEAARVPHLILQPLVENAIKYAVARTAAPVRIEIAAERAGEELVLQVRDSGAPEAGARPPGLGVGLKNVEGRLRSLYGEAGRLVCAPLSPSGFLAEVRLPLVL